MLAAVLHGRGDLRVEEVAEQPLIDGHVRVQVAFGGICGSDIHYYHRGGVGDFMLREPMVLGHEVAGTVLECGKSVHGIAPGDRVAINPSLPCRVCEFCVAGRSNLCENMRFLGSASLFPHVAGGFAQHLVLRSDQVIPVPPETDLLRLACAEPLSVALHAMRQAGEVLGKTVIVTGCGPIGLLSAAAALRAGAAEVVVTDIEDAPLAIARDRVGVTHAINVSEDGALDDFGRRVGYFDIAIEASGSPSALQSLFALTKRGGRIVQVGMLPPGSAPIPVNVLQSRELELVGSFRAEREFAVAVDFIVRNVIDVSPILSGTYALAEADEAMRRAPDRGRVVKLHLRMT